MQSITKSLFWEYVARNRWSLLAYPLLACVPSFLLLSMLHGIDTAGVRQELLGIHIASVLCVVIAVVAGVALTQGSPSRLYMKPISSTAITNFFFWGGALLVACQVAVLMTMLRLIFMPEWPIASPVLFSVVFWAAFQPFVRTSEQVVWWYALVPGVVILMFLWLMLGHGILFEEGGVFGPKAHYWSKITGTDLLIATGTVLTGYALTNWRIREHRCGRPVPSLLSWKEVQPFRSKFQAYQWFDFRSRTSVFAMVVLAQLVIFWVIALICSFSNPKLGWDFAFFGTFLAVIDQWLAAILIALSSGFGRSAKQIHAVDKDWGTPKLSADGIHSYLQTLPISPPDMARAMLRSSALSVGIATAAIALSLLLLGGLSQRWTNTSNPLQLNIDYWSLSILLVGGSMLISFALISRLPSIRPAARRLEYWIGLIAIAAVLLTLRSPALPLIATIMAGLCIAALAYSTLKSIRNRDANLTESLWIWLAATGCSLILSTAIPAEYRSMGVPILLILVAAAILPCFTTASEIRELRTS